MVDVVEVVVDVVVVVDGCAVKSQRCCVCSRVLSVAVLWRSCDHL